MLQRSWKNLELAQQDGEGQGFAQPALGHGLEEELG